MGVQVVPTIKKLVMDDFTEVWGQAKNGDYLLVITFFNHAG